MKYNYLKDARLIKNSDLCRYDSKIAYSTDFSTNGNVDYWDLYNNIYLYGQWGGVLFGTAHEEECYIGRSLTFVPVAAEFYYTVQIMMKITSEDSTNKPTQGKLRWVTLNNSQWEEEKEYFFDLHTGDDQWYQYSLNLGPEQYWHGDINNLRIYPFIDGQYKDRFAIKYIRISSINHFICSNRECPYYTNYSHPCLGAGKSGNITSGVAKEYYTTYSGVSDELLINIDGYGSEKIHLGTNINITGRNIARIITDGVSRLNIGSYTYAYAEHTEYHKLKIHSGAVGNNTSVIIDSGSALENLGFIDPDGLDVSTHENGIAAESGFDYAGSRRLKGFEINNISNSDTKSVAYHHSTSQYNVEAGRRNFDNSSTASNLTYIMGSVEHIGALSNISCTIIDISHPVNDNGRINHIYVNGDKGTRNAKVLILRPHKDGDYTVVECLSFPPTNSAMYTARHVTYRIDCNVLVNKGDVFGFYNIDVTVPFNHLMDTPNAAYFKVSGKPTGRFSPGSVNAYGTMGFAFYARSDRLQTNALLDVDLGQRTNIESVSVFGRELSDYFEYNIACCLDVSWDVALYGSTHRHRVCCWGLANCYWVTHTNIAYGIDCLNDCRRSSDNGQQGDSYALGSTGITTAGDHAYFYVNGDSEWENSNVCNGKSEWCWQAPWSSGDCYANTHEYKNDPFSFSLVFPHGFKTNVHKTIMYFKENKNFVGMSISYYLGSEGQLGNGPLPNYQLIPNYNTITLDGAEYTYGKSEGFTYYDAIEDLLFRNPTSNPSPIFVGDDCVNQDKVSTSHHVNWNIIEHTFDSVECGGICIHTNHHESTKINELEVYSMFPVGSTLVDNIDLQHSEYGEFWRPNVFVDDEHNSNRINTSVSASPRYLTIEISSQLDFELYGIGVYVSEEAKIDGCEKSISLEETKIGAISTVKSIELENIFNRPYDLSVNLPSDLFTNTSMLSWMKMDSEDSIKYPEIGPGGIVHKNSDFLIRNDNLQCAINCPCFGLKNLLLEKDIYHYVHGSEDGWELLTTYSGQSLNHQNLNLCYETIITFDDVSAKYWKISSDNTPATTRISSIEVFYNDEREQIKYVYDVSPNGIYSQPNETVPYVSSLYNNTEAEYVDLSWLISSEDGSTGIDTGTELVGTHNVTEVYSSPTITFIAEIDKLTDFTFTPCLYNQWVYNSNSYRDNHYAVYLLDEFGTEIIKIDFQNTLTSVYERFYYRGTLKYEAGSTSCPVRSLGGGRLRVIKQGSFISYELNGAMRCSGTYSYEFEGITSIKVVFYNSIAKQFMRYNEHLRLSGTSSCGFSLYNSEPLNKIVLRHYNLFPITCSLYNSNTNLDDYSGISGMCLVWNMFDKSAGFTLSNYDLTARYTYVNNWQSLRGTYPMEYNSGKYYWEVTINVISTHMVCISNSSQPLNYYIGDIDIPGGYSYYSSNGYLYENNQTAPFGSTYTVGDTIGIALDMNSLKLWFSKNGVWQGSGNPNPETGTDPATSILNYTYYAAHSMYYNTSQCTINFGEFGFLHQLPIGFDGFLVQEINELKYQKLNKSYYKYLVMDIEQRHKLDFIRNYGSLNNKYNLHLSTDIEFSTSAVTDIGSVVWDSTYSDARWLKISLLCGIDETTKVIDTLGLYPDINQNIAPGGGHYNCEWELLGDKLANYNTRSSNIALVATVSGSSTVVVSGTYDVMDPLSADRTIDGYSGSGFDKCWGFRSDDPSPTLELWFDGLYVINNIQLFHGQGDDAAYTNNDFTIEVATTSGGPFTEIVSVTGNTDLETTHVVDDTPVMSMKVKISNWQYGDIQMYNTDAEATISLDGGFIREVAVWTSIGGGEISSEDYPVICMDLGYQFNITSHGSTNKHTTIFDGDIVQRYMWSNNELFFKYSDSFFDDPHKFIFSDTQVYEYTVYEYTSEFLSNLEDETNHVFSDSVFFDVGVYDVDWESYTDYGESTVKLYITNSSNTSTLTPYDKNISSTWVGTHNLINIPYSGYYSIKASRSDTDTWGIRNISIIGKSGLVKWVALTCNKATDYSFDGTDKGIKYIDCLKVYGDEKYNPFEYDKWWYSVISSLSNDAMLVREGNRSLKIDYPTSSGIDMLEFLEGDSFGADLNWSEMDALSFWWYIEDIDKLDTDFGGFMFGNLTVQRRPNENPPGMEDSRSFQQALFEDPKKIKKTQIYYLWNISNMDLVSGWNNIKLKFCDFDATIPTHYGSRNALDIMLNLRSRPLASFGMMYKGKGSSFFMCLDNLKIERNRFLDTVKFSKGLCLTWGEFLDIPLSNMTVNIGTVEFWMKPYYNDSGVDLFGMDRSRTLFTITNNNNDMVSLGIRSLQWFEIGVGNSDVKYKAIVVESGMVPDSVRFQYKDLVHVALVWSNDGFGMDNGNTVRFYVGGELVLSSSETWEVGDNKSVNLRLGGGNCTSAYNSDQEGSAVFDNLKAYGYCKTKFDVENEGIDNDSVYTPNDFLQLSNNGVDFYGPKDGVLPFEFEQVPVGEKRVIHLRCNKSKEFKNIIKKTGDLEVTWTAVV